MNLAPKMPDFDLQEWSAKPYPERLRMMCAAWALDGFGVPPPIYLFYVLKMALYILGWAFFVSLGPGHGWIGDIANWWREPVAFQKLALWTLLFEVSGLGGASGPLTARYVPPIGASVYWLRPGTMRLPPWPKRIPFTAGTRRSVVDVALFAALLGLGIWALTQPALGRGQLLPVVLLLPVIGLRDKTIFLAARAEVHWSYLIVFLFPADVIAGSKIVQVAVWWGAATSKLNHHFPGVVTVMVSNSPFLKSHALRKKMYRRFPDDLRPSRIATLLAHGGTAIEYSFPLILLLSNGGTTTKIGLVMMFAFHSFILFSVPMGVPLEWNVFTMYAGLFLFGAHADVSIFSVDSPLLLAIMAVGLLIGPVLGNLRPNLISFLPSMRYYAGNWGASQWLFRRGMEERLDERIKKVAATLPKQLGAMFDEVTALALAGRGLAFRAMHLHGRAFNELIPRAVDDPERYDARDGEIIAGITIGWNFGDGHLHHHQLMEAIRERCAFEPGDLRVIYLESQPIQRQAHHYAIWDAATGLIEQGWVEIRGLLARQPWEATPPAARPDPVPAETPKKAAGSTA
ncbi:MAG: DUF3556 domain-containing protein [Actinomycetota bacterium]